MIFSVLLVALGIIIDNTIEGYKKNKRDSLNGDYPILINPSKFFILKILRIFFYFGGIFFSIIFSKNAFFWVVLSVFLAFLYNNHKISVHKYAPLDSLLHFLGGITFTATGGFWEGDYFLKIIPFGIAFGLIFTGGYWNHLLLDKERDKEMGKLTLAHKMSFKKIKIFSIVLIFLGDLLMGYLLSFEFIFFAFIFGIGAFLLFFFGLKIKSEKKFRSFYRILHLFLALFLLIFFILF